MLQPIGAEHCPSAEPSSPLSAPWTPKSEHAEMRSLSPKFCSCWNKHGLTLPWLTELSPLLSSKQRLVCISLPHPFHCFKFWEALFYLLFLKFPSLLQCMALTLLAMYHYYISYHINLFCHLIFAKELSFRKSDFAQKYLNKSLSQKDWENKSECQVSFHLSTLCIMYEIPAPKINFVGDMTSLIICYLSVMPGLCCSGVSANTYLQLSLLSWED